MTYREGDELETYLLRRWRELRVPEQMAEITVRNLVTPAERRFLRDIADARKAGRRMLLPTPRAFELEESYKRVQCSAFVQIVGEMHHVLKMPDVGLSIKNSGNSWELADGRHVAADIVTLNPLDGPGNFILVDALTSVGSPDTRPTWSELGPNTDASRPWTAPPVPADTPPVEEPGDPGIPVPVRTLEELWTRVVKLEALEEALAAHLEAADASISRLVVAIATLEAGVNLEGYIVEGNTGRNFAHAHSFSGVVKRKP